MVGGQYQDFFSRNQTLIIWRDDLVKGLKRREAAKLIKAAHMSADCGVQIWEVSL